MSMTLDGKTIRRVVKSPTDNWIRFEFEDNTTLEIEVDDNSVDPKLSYTGWATNPNMPAEDTDIRVDIQVEPWE
jgi:hypothetical protein